MGELRGKDEGRGMNLFLHPSAFILLPLNMDLTRITIFCFTASYVVALALEAWSLVRRFGWHRPVLLGFAGAGVFAHGAYLLLRAGNERVPLASPAEWYLMVALVLAAFALAANFWWPKVATGLFVLPLVLGLIAGSQLASPVPLGAERASRLWGQVHSWSLILATVAVSLGFLAGLMYLIQSWRLKRKLPPWSGFRLPSLELLERINGRALALSTWLVAGGFLTGLLLVWTRKQQIPATAGGSLWTDPVVISLAGMLAWLLAAEVFRQRYPAARRGRKVAYLTLASFGFLVITLAAMTLTNEVHRPARDASATGTVFTTQTDDFRRRLIDHSDLRSPITSHQSPTPTA